MGPETELHRVGHVKGTAVAFPLLLIAAVVFAGRGHLPAEAAVPAADRPAAGSAVRAWRPLRRATVERTEVGAARIGSFIYVAGGYEPLPFELPPGVIADPPAVTSGTLERYDIRRNRWRRMKPMPIPVHHPAVAVAGGKLYVYGGYTGFVGFDGEVSDALQRFDPRTGRWSVLRSSPTNRGAAAMVAMRGRLFAIGGSGDSPAYPTLRTVEIYDIRRGRWRKGPPMGVAREHLAAVAAGGRIYAFGGRDDGANLAAVEQFDPRRKGWSRLPPLRHPRSGIAAVAVRGRPVVFGGEELTPGGETIAPTELFDPRARRWRLLPAMRTPRHGLGGAALGRRVFAVEGGPSPGLRYSDALEFLDVPRRLLR